MTDIQINLHEHKPALVINLPTLNINIVQNAANKHFGEERQSIFITFSGARQSNEHTSYIWTSPLTGDMGVVLENIEVAEAFAYGILTVTEQMKEKLNE